MFLNWCGGAAVTMLDLHFKSLGCQLVFKKKNYFEGFTSIPAALTANDRNRKIQEYQASDG